MAIAFGVTDAEWIAEADVERRARLSALGPDLLAASPDLVEARRRMRTCGASHIADALIAQQAVAGLGNVYKSEVLFLEHTYPFTPVADVSDDTLERLLLRGRHLLLLNVAEGRASGRAGPGRITTGRMNPAEALWVYGRTGRRCRRCGSIVRSRGETDGRRTYWCPGCQPAPDAHGPRMSRE